MSNEYLDIAMEKVIKQEVNAVLDKIRAEIEQGYCKVENNYDQGRNMGLHIAVQIIDKYRESEE